MYVDCPGIDVLIPVYNAFSDAAECVQSVLATIPAGVVVRVIDDASPEGDFRHYLGECGFADLLQDARLHLSRNENNIGFVCTSNLLMRAAGHHDVILLNADTVVTPNWVEKLNAAAYHKAGTEQDNIGLVSPFTNNGVVCSFPLFCLDNELPQWLTLEELNEVTARVSVHEYPELPTCMGFCVYIRRCVLDKVGLFDEDSFSLGYGEENDLSLRAQEAGYVDILDDATFIHHKGSLSFGEEKHALGERNSKIIKQRYPHYFDTVSKFCSRDSIRPARLRILDELVSRWNSTHQRRILHVVHNGPRVPRRDPLGGTEMHVQDLLDNVADVAQWSLVPARNCYYLTAHLPGMDREFILSLSQTSLVKLLNPDFFDVIHVHHTRWLDHAEVCDALIQHGNYIISFHDYMLVCPRFHLYTPFRQVCTGSECSSACGYSDQYVTDYRAQTKRVLDNARSLVCFSESTRKWIESILQAPFNWNKQPHGILNAVPAAERRLPNPIDEDFRTGKRPLRIAFVGSVPQHKGSLVIEEMLPRKELCSDVQLEWHMIGKLFLEAGDLVIDHGTYQRDELRERIQTVQPDLIAILSICPETYCLTLDEAWNAGVPVIVSNFGAPPERVRESGAGWILPEVSAPAFFGLLQEILADPAELGRARNAIASTQIQSVIAEGDNYRELYTQFGEPQSNLAVLLSYLREFGMAYEPQRSLFMKICGRLTSYAIYGLDTLKVRDRVQLYANQLLPRRFINVLKSAR